jgi:hypothetical protein
MRGLHYDVGAIHFHPVHPTNGIFSIALIIKLHEGISMLELAVDDFAILGEQVLKITLTRAVR